MITTRQRSMALYSAAAALLCIPLIAMQFTEEVQWTFSDCVIAGVLLFGTAGAVDFVLRQVKGDSKRFLYIAIALIILILMWAELAVGIFGTPFAGN